MFIAFFLPQGYSEELSPPLACLSILDVPGCVWRCHLLLWCLLLVWQHHLHQQRPGEPLSLSADEHTGRKKIVRVLGGMYEVSCGEFREDNGRKVSAFCTNTHPSSLDSHERSVKVSKDDFVVMRLSLWFFNSKVSIPGPSVGQQHWISIHIDNAIASFSVLLICIMSTVFDCLWSCFLSWNILKFILPFVLILFSSPSFSLLPLSLFCSSSSSSSSSFFLSLWPPTHRW